ncbi:MAG: hypothetical protein EOO08_07930 [Chitinophagaceae bacterium]|nr:MAG: hypothetical protein EOO08_07930 [Chitinophagaceae bacterium]
MLAYSISVWARGHKAAARVLLIVTFVLLNATAWVAGNWLAAEGHTDIGIPFYLSTIAGTLLLLSYPARRARFLQRKMYDGALAACTFTMVMLLSAAPEGSLPIGGSSAQAASVRASAQAPPKYKKLMRKWARKLRAHYRDGSDGQRAGLIVLTVLVGILLIVGVLALACSIACSGAEVVAIIVGALGVVGVVWGAVAVIRRIVKGPRKKAEPANVPAG